MDTLPDNILDSICKALTIKEIVLVSSLCKYLNKFVNQNDFFLFCKSSYTTFRARYVRRLMTRPDYFKRIYLSHPDLSNYDLDGTFRIACEYNYLDLAKWLIKTLPCINIRALHDHTFHNTCGYNHLEVAIWLKKICPEINVKSENDYVFKWVCACGYLEMAKYLVAVHTRDHKHIKIKNLLNALVLAEKYGHTSLAEWLKTIIDGDSKNLF